MSDQSTSNEQEPENTSPGSKEKKLGKFPFFRDSSIAKQLSAYKEKLKTTKQGKRLLVAINALSLVGLAGASYFLTYESDDFFNPPDYILTEEQVNEGYSRTREEGNRLSRGVEDVYYRFYEDEEYSLPSCNTDYDWCVFALPLHIDCYEITMKFETTKADDSSEVVEEMSVSVQSKNGLPFSLGQRVTLGLAATKADSMYGGVRHIRCTEPSSN